jgi:hypothetical protein
LLLKCARRSFVVLGCLEQSEIPRSANSRADRFDWVKSPILRGDLYILVCPSAPLSSVTLFSTSPAPATSPQRKNSEEFSSVNSTSISRRLKSKQRFGSWVSFWRSNQIADLSLFAGRAAKWQRERGSPRQTRPMAKGHYQGIASQESYKRNFVPKRDLTPVI